MRELLNNRARKVESVPYEIEEVSYPEMGKRFWCPECGATTQYPIPVEPLYFLDEVYKLVPFPTLAAARRYLQRNADLYEPLYIRVHAANGTKGGGARVKRVLLASDVRRLRNDRLSRGIGSYAKGRN